MRCPSFVLSGDATMLGTREQRISWASYFPHPCVLRGLEDLGRRVRATVGWSRGRGHSCTSSSARMAAGQGANEKWGERQGLQGDPSCSDR